jgi:CRISPR-associated endoribonuclease Cas6
MNLETVLSKTELLALTFTIMPRESLKLPRDLVENTFRGAFGNYFRQLVCTPSCHTAMRCPLPASCPYKVIFEPSQLPTADRLSKNHDIPRPFIFELCPDNYEPTNLGNPMTTPFPTPAASRHHDPTIETHTYGPGARLQFRLLLIGKAVEYLPYFVLSFREVERKGLGLNRALCDLEAINSDFRLAVVETFPGDRSTPPDGRATELESVYSSRDQTVRVPRVPTMDRYINRRLPELRCGIEKTTNLAVRFLTPTSLRYRGRQVRAPEFHHFFKRLRDRVNSLCTAHGPGPVDVDFKALGHLSEQVKTLYADTRWVQRTRFSSRRRLRHELSGFVGKCVYDFSSLSQGAYEDFLPWLLAGELLHVGKYTVWGNGRFACTLE